MSSSSTEDVGDRRTEGFILPPKNSQTPSQSFMLFCDEIVQNSKQDTSPLTEESTGEDYKPLYKRQLEDLKQKHHDNAYSQVCFTDN